jgi:23S rRNA pseudouridine1911/1915/1917 synthase
MKPFVKDPEVLYLDNHLFVLNKPAGITTQPDPQENANLEDWGKAWIKNHFNRSGNVFLEAAHRIDKPVSGIVLFARTSKALSRMQAFMRQNEFKKKYFGVIEGKVAKKEGIFEDWIAHGNYRAEIKRKGQGKWSSLHYRVILEDNVQSLVEISLNTGRYHQIRIQFASRGFPLLGDNKYGSAQHFISSETIALHHFQLQVPHPISRKILTFEASLPSFWPLSFRNESSFV